MIVGHDPVCRTHDPGPGHPDAPERLDVICETVETSHDAALTIPGVQDMTLEAVHDGAYLRSLREFCDDGGGQWDADTRASSESWRAINRSASLAAWAVDEAVEEDQTSFACCRPPGHHAVADDAMGFCFCNNAVIATLRALASVDRVAIVDWDVHHGNGTQDLLYDRGDVLYCSVHQRGIYPGTGSIGDVGRGAGDGATLNVPLPRGCGDATYAQVYDRVLEPALADFGPDLILISAGFDAHVDDAIAGMVVTSEGFGMLTDRVGITAAAIDSSLCFLLEGGYALDPLATSIDRVCASIEGYKPSWPADEIPDRAMKMIDAVRSSHPLFDGG